MVHLDMIAYKEGIMREWILMYHERKMVMTNEGEGKMEQLGR